MFGDEWELISNLLKLKCKHKIRGYPENMSQDTRGGGSGRKRDKTGHGVKRLFGHKSVAQKMWPKFHTFSEKTIFSNFKLFALFYKFYRLFLKFLFDFIRLSLFVQLKNRRFLTEKNIGKFGLFRELFSSSTEDFFLA